MKFPEHALQTQIKAFVREAVAVPHLFLAFDRTRKMSQLQHVFEKARGVKSGTPDTVLLVQDFPSVWCELKAGANKPSEHQINIATEITTSGHLWFWCNSVDSYRRGLKMLGIPMRPNAWLIAEHRDRLLSRPEAMNAQTKPRATRKPRTTKPTLAQIRRSEALRLLPR